MPKKEAEKQAKEILEEFRKSVDEIEKSVKNKRFIKDFKKEEE